MQVLNGLEEKGAFDVTLLGASANTRPAVDQEFIRKGKLRQNLSQSLIPKKLMSIMSFQVTPFYWQMLKKFAQ